MAKVKNVGITVEDAVKRVKELNDSRSTVVVLNEELEVHKKDLSDIETLKGTDSEEYKTKKEICDSVISKLQEEEKKVNELSFKKSELKPALDELTKEFETAYREETAKEYHIEIAETKEDEKNGKGKKVFKQLLEYLYHNVSFTPKTAVNLMMLVRNMEENKPWVHSKDFDNVIILRSNSIISLWRFIMEDLSGKGFYEARTFLECWAHCGQSVSNAVREIQKSSAVSREIATNLNLVEEEFNRSENDIPEEEVEMTTKEEVSPDVED